MDGRVLFTDEVLNMRGNLYCFRGVAVLRRLTSRSLFCPLVEDGQMDLNIDHPFPPLPFFSFSFLVPFSLLALAGQMD